MNGNAAMQAGGVEAAAPVDGAVSAITVGLLLGAGAASIVIATRVARRLRRGLPVVEPRAHPPASWHGGDVAVIAAAYVGLLAATGLAVGATPALRIQLAADVATKTAATLVGIGVLRAAGASWAAIGFPGGRWRDDLRLAGGALALVLAPLLALAAALDRIVPYRHPVVAFLQEHRDPVAIGLVILAAVVVAPVAEEFFFRRVLQGWLEVRLPEADGAAASGLAAAAFAAAHVGHGLAAAPLFLFGVVLGIVARRTGALAPCVLLHAAFNAVSVGLLLVAPAGQAAG